MTDTNKSALDFSKIDVIDMCYFLNGRADLSKCEMCFQGLEPHNISKVEMYEYIKFKTDNFEKYKFSLLIDEIRWFSPIVDKYCDFNDSVILKENISVDDVIIWKHIQWRPEKYKLHEYIIALASHDYLIHNTAIVRFSEIAEDLFNTICETKEMELRKSGIAPEPANTQTPHPKLIKRLSIIQQKNLFDMLIDNELLSSETDFDSFCFVFGSYLMPNDFKPLKWLKNRQLLRELITELKHPDAIMRTTKYTLPLYFIDKNDEPITELPTNTPKDLKIEHYLNNLANI